MNTHPDNMGEPSPSEEAARNTGIDVIGYAPWGTHFCQFYQTTQDLIDILVPYFKAGLEANEFCMWVTSPPLVKQEAEAALRKAVPDLDRYLASGQIEILSYSEWYLKGGTFESQRVLDGWVEKLEEAQAKGFDGLRLSGNTFWLEKPDWGDFADYEEAVNNVIGNYAMIALCTYSLEKCSAPEIVDVIATHQFALVKREGKWEIIESDERRRLEVQHQQTEEALRRERLLSETAISSLPGIFYLFDSEGHLLKWNENLERVTGYSGEEIEKMQPLDFFEGEDRQTVEEGIREVFSRGESTVEAQLRSKDGRKTPYFFTGMRAQIDGAECVIGTGMDIAERMQIEEALRERETDLNRAQAVGHIGSWRLDVRRNELKWSDESYRMFDIPPGTPLTYEAFLDRVYPDDREYVNNAWQAGLRGEPYDIDHRIIANGEVKWIRERAELEFDADGGLIGGFGTCQDITERKVFEEELKRANAIKDDFVSMVSHEMRTPLTSILGGAALLLDRNTLSEGDRRELLTDIRAGADRLAIIIDNMLSLARAESQKPQLSPINLTEVIQATAARHRERYPHRDLREIVEDRGLTVSASREYLGHVLSNLLENAEKYSPRDMPIELDVRPEGEEVAIRVYDRGIGLAGQEIESLFKPFYRSAEADRLSAAGVGIGLTVSKRLVEAMGGRIWAMPREGGGSEFGFSLAITPASR